MKHLRSASIRLLLEVLREAQVEFIVFGGAADLLRGIATGDGETLLTL